MADSLLDGTKPSITREDIIAKWKDKPQEELLAAKAESDLYIETMKARFDDLSKDYLDAKDQLKTGAQLKELLDRLDNPKNADTNSNDTDLGQVQPGMKPEDVQKLIAAEIAANQRSNTQNQNFSTIQKRLREQYGDNYSDVYKTQLDTLGLTPEFADDLAKNHPSVFIKTFGLDAQQQSSQQTLPRSSQRHSSFAPQTQKRDWNYYQELKKNNPRLYLDPKIAVQMHNDAIDLGDAFGMPQD